MKTDRMTKTLLALIALGLLLNALNPWLHPNPAFADVQDLGNLESYVIDISSTLRSIRGEVRNIATGLCLNGKIC